MVTSDAMFKKFLNVHQVVFKIKLFLLDFFLLQAKCLLNTLLVNKDRQKLGGRRLN